MMGDICSGNLMFFFFKMHFWSWISFLSEPFDLSNTARSVYDEYVFASIERVIRNSFTRLRQSGNIHSILDHPLWGCTGTVTMTLGHTHAIFNQPVYQNIGAVVRTQGHAHYEDTKRRYSGKDSRPCLYPQPTIMRIQNEDTVARTLGHACILNQPLWGYQTKILWQGL